MFNASRLANAIYTASTETVPRRWIKKVRPWSYRVSQSLVVCGHRTYLEVAGHTVA